MNEEVTAYIQKTETWQQGVSAQLRQMIFEVVPDVEERLQYGKPHYLKNGHYLAVIHAGKGKLAFMLFNAAGIEAEKGFMRSMGNGDRKVVDIVEGQTVDSARLATLLKQAASTL